MLLCSSGMGRTFFMLIAVILELRADGSLLGGSSIERICHLSVIMQTGESPAETWKPGVPSNIH